MDAVVLKIGYRCLSTTCIAFGKKNFRKFPLYNKRGTLAYKEQRSRNAEHMRGVRPVGYYKNEDFVVVPEMIPELIVPDLTGFKLKPYVSYRVPDVVQSEFTAKDLFDACYAQKIVEDFKANKLDSDGNPIEPSDDEKLTAEEAYVNARKTGSDIFKQDPPLEDPPTIFCDKHWPY